MSRIIDAYCIPGTKRETLLSPDDLLRQMDTAGIAQAVIAPEDREIAIHNTAGNERIRRLAEAHADRFIPACTVNPWLGEEGGRLLQRAVAAGSKMLVIAPALPGFYLTDEVTGPLLGIAAELCVPVYVHTGPHSASAPTQLVLLASACPDVRFILGHCGSTDYSHDMTAVARSAPSNIWFELSFVRPWAMASMGALLDDARMIFGSSAPRNVPAFELKHFDEYWPIAAHRGTYGENLNRLIGEVVS